MNSKGLAQLAYEKGMYVLTAAQSYQAALEISQLGHGLLTYALVVQGLKELMADNRPRDGRVLMGEWLDYATERVPQMQRGAMQQKRELGGSIAFAGDGSQDVQRPRVFYPRELAARPLIVTKAAGAAWPPIRLNPHGPRPAFSTLHGGVCRRPGGTSSRRPCPTLSRPCRSPSPRPSPPCRAP